MRKILEGSQAVAETIKNIEPAVVSAYPITPQTHIVETLAEYKANGEGKYEYVLAESEFAAASIVEGAAARGVRVYSATSSQGLLLMTEVLFNIAGMRLPVVLTVANRAVSAPINIWNDQQDSVTVRDSGWLSFYAEDNQEAIDLHLEAFKIAEQVRLPVMVNMDGYILTHTYEPVDIPSRTQIRKFLPEYQPSPGTYLDIRHPKTLGAFATPETYMEIRKNLFKAVAESKDTIKKVHAQFKKEFKRGKGDGLVETYKLDKAEVVLVSFGSVLGTIKEVVDELRQKGQRVGILKICCFRPFPFAQVNKYLSKAKYIAVIEKCVSLGYQGILASEIKASCYEGRIKGKISSFVVGLGGKDVTQKNIRDIIARSRTTKRITEFIYG